MNKNKYNPYENMLAVLDEAASRLGLKEADYITLRYPEREMIVSIPVRMDNGEMKVFEGYRVQHNSARGPYNTVPEKRSSRILKPCHCIRSKYTDCQAYDCCNGRYHKAVPDIVHKRGVINQINIMIKGYYI